jgi:SPOR domain
MPTSLLRLLLAVFVCLWASQAQAARWQDHRTAGLRAIEEVDYAKAIEQLGAAIYYAEALPADDRDIADLWETLAATYMADEQYSRAWDSIAHWDKILVDNAGQAWAEEQQSRRDQMTRILFDVTRTEEGEAAGAGERMGDLAPAGDDLPSAQTSHLPTPAEDVAAPPATPEAPAEDVAAPAATPVAPVKDAATPVDGARGYGIHLASYTNEANARSGWAILQARYPDLLGDKRFALRSVDLGDRGVFIRLIAVPFADSAAAKAACAALERRAQYCAVMQAD